jgi:predicted metal-dependent hydrolase
VIDRPAHALRAVDLFNTGRYWEAHEELEVIWRSVPDEHEALVLQGLIQSAAALLHRERNNSHGVRRVGEAALEKLAGQQHPAIEFETVEFRDTLEAALVRGGPSPTLRLRTT